MAIEANFNKLIFLKKFNNYFNRKVIGFSSVCGYVNAVTDYQVRENVNFNPNEGTLSEIVINDLPFEPDYCLVLDSSEKIESRWFVIEVKRTRKAQAHISLKRDVIYDYLPALLDAPIYVHKAMLEETDPFILNDEGMSLNQIKKQESLLMDPTKCPWLVVYYAKNLESKTVTTKHFSFSFPGSFSNTNMPSKEPYDIVMFPFGYMPYKHAFRGLRTTYTEAISQKLYSLEIVQGIIESFGTSIYDVQLLPYSPFSKNMIDIEKVGGVGESYLDSKIVSNCIFNYFEGEEPNSDESASITLKDYELVTISNQKYQKFTYTFTLDQIGIFPASDLVLSTSASAEGVDIWGATHKNNEGTPPMPNPNFSIAIEEVKSVSGYEALINGLKVTVTYKVPSNTDLISNMQITIFARAVSESEAETGTFGVFIQDNQFEVDIIQPDNLIPAETSLKILSNCYRYRIVSPNYQGSFEINAAKNGGTLQGFKAYCTYKPFTPMIKVAPRYSLLYGSNFKDDRGLICSSNFSITMITSQWVEYQLQNKNYQNIFNRDIQNLDFNQDVAMREAIVGGVVGTMQGALAGAAAGGMAAGSFGAPAGAAVGAAIGAAASGIAAAADVEFLGMKQKEERSYAIDKYSYQLGNIKAIPNTLTKVTSFDILCKIFPFVEKYSCTDKELQAFKDKIKYESMTVMRIDKMRNFYNKYEELCYFKGELIRTDDIAADSHIVDVIYQELMKGVFL